VITFKFNYGNPRRPARSIDDIPAPPRAARHTAPLVRPVRPVKKVRPKPASVFRK